MGNVEEVSGAPPDAPHAADLEVPQKVSRTCEGRLKEFTLRERFVGPERAGETVQARVGCGNEVRVWLDTPGPFLCEYCSGEREPVRPLNTREMLQAQDEAALYEMVDRVLERARNYLGRCPDCRREYAVVEGSIVHPGGTCYPGEAKRRTR